MDYEYSNLVAQAQDWAKDVVKSAWASEIELEGLLKYDARTPETLFKDVTARPLIVAFLGGTGVGKSTLLNRLAGKDIARTGVLRPTSKEVTLFHHSSVQITQLPSRLPLDKIKIAEHTESSKKHIIWIDMPDFDSTEQSNQQLVLEWLPHIDVLVYVVSPERYRDNKAWQLLLAEGGKHAWVFVLNQADRGQPEQYQDFIKQLGKAGFSNPLVFQSCCAEQKAAEQLDEFDDLQRCIQALATGNTVNQLELRSAQVRKAELAKSLEDCMSLLGPVNVHNDLDGFWQEHWLDLQALLVESVALPIKQLAEHYALHSGDLSGKEAGNRIHHRLWDQWAQARFEDALDALILQADQLGLSVMPMKQVFLPIRAKAEKLVEEKSLLSVRKALIKPGNVLQRAVIKIANFSEIVLPIASMGWVGYQVFIEFYESSLAEVPHYLGVDFAVNSILLIAISWLFPYFLKKKLKPSVEKAALKGLNRGFENALQNLEFEVLDALKQNAHSQVVLRAKAERVVSACHADSERVIDMGGNPVLERMLL